jgi:DNA polymerase (family 10)
MLLHRAEATILGTIEALTGTPGVRSIEPAGSFRRRRESIGDLDLLAETDDGPRLI